MPTSDDTPLLIDVMLGKLATYLRMCGYDAVYALDRGIEADDRLLALARREGRRLVTRDVELAGRTDDAFLIDSRGVEGQLRELGTAGFELSLSEPARCARCNGRLERVPDGGSTPTFAPDPETTTVWRCAECGHPFWKGSHWRDVERTLQDR